MIKKIQFKLLSLLKKQNKKFCTPPKEDESYLI